MCYVGCSSISGLRRRKHLQQYFSLQSGRQTHSTACIVFRWMDRNCRILHYNIPKSDKFAPWVKFRSSQLILIFLRRPSQSCERTPRSASRNAEANAFDVKRMRFVSVRQREEHTQAHSNSEQRITPISLSNQLLVNRHKMTLPAWGTKAVLGWLWTRPQELRVDSRANPLSIWPLLSV